jgi:hypothetical protein
MNIRKRIEKMEKILNTTDEQISIDEFCFADHMELYNYLKHKEDYHQIIKKSNIITTLNRQKPGAGNKFLDNCIEYLSKINN